MLTIRLSRVGRKNDPSFRIIVTDSKHKPKTGKFLEVVGSYDPRINRVDVRGDRVTHWIKNGAQVSDTVHNILVKQKIVDAPKRHLSAPSGARKGALIKAIADKEAKVKADAEAALKAEADALAAAEAAKIAEAEAAAAPAAEEAPISEVAVETTTEEATPVSNEVA